MVGSLARGSADDAALPEDLEVAGKEEGADAAAPLRELDSPLGLFLARLGMRQHLPALVRDEMSLDLLRLLSEDDLHSNLGEMGLSRGARCRIILGLRELADDGTGGASNDDSATGGGSGEGASGTCGSTRARATGGENEDSKAEVTGPTAATTTTTTTATTTTEKPAWYHAGFEDIS